MSDSSPTRLNSELLARPAAVAVRVVASARLDVCVDALDKLESGEPNALHDLRVALRRLRSWLRTFRPYLDDTIRRKTLRRLRRLVRSTNSARDLEVWIEWIAEQRVDSASARRGMLYLSSRLTIESGEVAAGSVTRTHRRLPRLVSALREELSTYSVHIQRDTAATDATMALATADALRDGCRRWRRRIAQIESERDAEAIHRTRIAAKRLRYLVESLDSRKAATDVATALSEFQDLLGAVHDMQLLVDRVLDELEIAAAADARRRVLVKLGEEDDRDEHIPARAAFGMSELAQRAKHHAHESFERFRSEWDDRAVERIDAMVKGIANDLEGLSND